MFCSSCHFLLQKKREENTLASLQHQPSSLFILFIFFVASDIDYMVCREWRAEVRRRKEMRGGQDRGNCSLQIFLEGFPSYSSSLFTSKMKLLWCLLNFHLLLSWFPRFSLWRLQQHLLTYIDDDFQVPSLSLPRSLFFLLMMIMKKEREREKFSPCHRFMESSRHRVGSRLAIFFQRERRRRATDPNNRHGRRRWWWRKARNIHEEQEGEKWETLSF